MAVSTSSQRQRPTGRHGATIIPKGLLLLLLLAVLAGDCFISGTAYAFEVSGSKLLHAFALHEFSRRAPHVHLPSRIRLSDKSLLPIGCPGADELAQAAFS